MDVKHGPDYLIVEGVWLENQVRYVIANIYAPCQLGDRRNLWNLLLAEKSGSPIDLWCVMGDFNSIRDPLEIKGVARDISFFNQWIRDMDIIDLSLVGRKFIWYNSGCYSISRLDRIMLSDHWLRTWPNSSQWGLQRDISDHCPMVLKYINTLNKPKPFRINNCWFQHRDFSAMVTTKWKEKRVLGWGAFVIKEKLKLLKADIKEWNKFCFGCLDTHIGEIGKRILELDVQGERVDLNNQQVEEWKNLIDDFWRVFSLKESLLMQKSRNKWLQEGDASTCFFYANIMNRRRRNKITTINVGGVWIQNQHDLEEAIKNYFEVIYTEKRARRPTLDGIDFNVLSEEESDNLTITISKDEVRSAVWNCDNDKSPGPDGYNFKFFKEFWGVVKEDVCRFILEIQSIAKLPRGLKLSFITLIPKISSPQSINDYRPISLVESLYKILSKILSIRLKNILHALISSSQSAFLKNRNILDGVVIVNEVIDKAKKDGDGCIRFKADFEKAYDSISWDFLDYMMQRFGFKKKWRRWIKECLASTMISILIDGSPLKEFSVTKELRQGDPLAHFLFLMMAEGFSGLMRKASQFNMFHGFKMGNEEIEVTNLQFADDTIVVWKPLVENFWTLKQFFVPDYYRKMTMEVI